jgi:hypothetical protein
MLPSMCVSPQALASGLILRIERDGHVPASREIAALLALGCPRDDLRRAFTDRGAERADSPFARALALLDALSPPA